MQLLAQQQQHLDQERQLQAQVMQRKSLADEAESLLQSRLDEERWAAMAAQQNIAAEQAAIARSRELVESANRQTEESRRLIEEATEQRVAEEQRATLSEQAQLQAEQAACRAAQARADIAEQAGHYAAQQHEMEQMLLAQQQARLENERQLLAETEMLARSETLAGATSEDRKAAMQRARETAQNRALLEQEAAIVARQLAELEEGGNARLHEQTVHSRAEVMTRRLLMRLDQIGRIGTPWKVAGMIAAMIMIGLSLGIGTMQPAVVGHTARAGTARADKNVFGNRVGQDGQGRLKSGDVGRTANLALGDLKLTDHLGDQ